MSTVLYAEQEANFRFRGDTVVIDGNANISGTLTATMIGLKTAYSPSGTKDAAVWTTGAPAFTDGQKFITVTCGSTIYRIPVWSNS